MIIWFLSPPLLAWVSPALLGLFLAVPLSQASGSEALGRALSRFALLRTPEEIEVPALLARRTAELIAEAAALPRRRTAVPGSQPRCAAGAYRRQPAAAERTRAAGRTRMRSRRSRSCSDARTLEEALEWLTPGRAGRSGQRPAMLNQLALLPDAQRPAFII